ncbi:MAG: hypothetical protein V8S27_07605 [Lachnospiraceae bacterium]
MPSAWIWNFRSPPSAICFGSLRTRRWRDYDDLEVSNNLYRHLLNEGENAQAEELFEKARKTEKLLLERFKKTQDALVRIDWYGNVLYRMKFFSRI